MTPAAIRNQPRPLKPAKVPPAPAAQPPVPRFSIAGIGASAGGLGAFEAFLSGLPSEEEPGLAFVLVQHLSPDHQGQLAELVRHCTRMAVMEVEEGIRVQPNRVYVIPPGSQLTLVQGVLHLKPMTGPAASQMPIDTFFRALALDQGEQAIGVLLAGTGCDGTQGLRAIKAAGGMVMVQTPGATANDRMVRSALTTGLVDYVLPPDQMPPLLMAYALHGIGRPTRPSAVLAPGAEEALGRLFILLRALTGHDFSQYKRSAVRRRIERRMALQELGAMEDYVKFCQKHPLELEALFHDFLIGVTSFFRDAESFRALEQAALPKLLAERPEAAQLRVWSVGCSTGEEAYGLAMIFAEQMTASGRHQTVKVFATDLDPNAIATARKGRYPASALAAIGPERLARWFTQEAEGGYQVLPALRDLVVFSEQDLIRDLPISRLDLICCRNLLIYLDGNLQARLFPMFHYLLNPGGVLMLGTSETIHGFGHLFTAVSREARIFARVEHAQAGPLEALGQFLPSLQASVPAFHVPTGGTPPAPGAKAAKVPRASSGPAKVLGGKQDDLQATNDALRRAMEAMRTVNEELQSTNEEMETAKGELQALNESMGAAEKENLLKLATLTQVNNDMNNLLAGTHVGTVFVDMKMNILRFTPTIAEMINLIPGDVGRPIGHIVCNLAGYDRLVEDTQAVLDYLEPVEHEVQTRTGRWFTLRIQPYRTLDNLVEGAVITFVDITGLKTAQEALKVALKRSRAENLEAHHDRA